MDRDLLLTIKQVIEFEDSNFRNIQKKIQRGKIKAFKIEIDNHQGFEYRIPLSELSIKAQQKYFEQIKQTTDAEPLKVKEKTGDLHENLALKDLTESQREQVYFWKETIKQWQDYISDAGTKKVIKTEEFVQKVKEKYPDLKISRRTLLRKWNSLKTYGDVGLADLRGQSPTEGTHRIDEVLTALFGQWWLDENRPTVASVYRLVEEWAKINRPDLLPLPSVHMFYRLTNQYPKHIIEYFRNGKKSFEDNCMPYIIREYESLAINEVWSSDYHTLDLMVKDDITGEIFRPHLIYWIDIRSRKVLSFYLSKTSNSDGTFISFRKAVLAYGVPENVYLDNGMEFSVSDIGGRGKRKTDRTADYGTTLFNRLGIKVTNALVKNAKAKIIERMFLNVKNDFSKFYNTYTGGKPEERPERHKEVIKDTDNIKLFSELKVDMELYINGWCNKKSSSVKCLNGLSPDEFYAENFVKKKALTREQEELLLLRTVRLQTVTRAGVKYAFENEELWYYNTDLIVNYLGLKVYLRYNPENMNMVQVYDDKEKFICTAELTKKGGYNLKTDVDKEVIKENNSRKKKIKNNVNSFMNNLKSIQEAPEALEVLKSAAKRNMEENKLVCNPKIIAPLSFSNLALNNDYKEDEEVEISMETMVKNTQLRRAKDE